MGLFGLWCTAWLVIGWAMLHPAPPPLGGVSDKLVHFASFMLISFAAIAFCRTARALLGIAVVCAIAAVALELAQSWVPNRLTESGDMLANLAGVLAGTALAALVLALVGRRWRAA